MSEILTDLGDILSVADGTKQYTGVEPIQVDNVLNKISIDESAITGKDWTQEINAAVADESRLRYENDQVLQNDINTRQTWINWNTAEGTEELAIDGINTDEGFIGFKDSISDYATKTEVEGMISSQAIPKSELDNLATKDELTAYPTKSEVSAELAEKQDSLTNAQLSAISSVSSMYNMLTAISAMVSAQWTLEAGNGITITNDETNKKSTISLT